MWGYVTRRREFVNWAYNMASGARLVNPAPVLEWGSDKTYLVDVAAEEVPIVPTIWVRAGDRWRPPSGDYVIKPSVASGGMGAARYVNHGFEVADRHVRQLLAEGQTVLVQPYQPTVDEEGETALIYFGGNYSHAVRKEALTPFGCRRDRPALGATDHHAGRSATRPVARRQRGDAGGRTPGRAHELCTCRSAR